MNSGNAHDEIGTLLRAHKPDAPPPPMLAAQIIAALGPRQTGQPATRWWLWLPLPPALAAAVTLWIWHQPAPPVSPVSQNPPPAAATPFPESVVSQASMANPLQAETRALSRDAERARVFLIDCLPSFASAGK